MEGYLSFAWDDDRGGGRVVSDSCRRRDVKLEGICENNARRQRNINERMTILWRCETIYSCTLVFQAFCLARR